MAAFALVPDQPAPAEHAVSRVALASSYNIGVGKPFMVVWFVLIYGTIFLGIPAFLTWMLFGLIGPSGMRLKVFVFACILILTWKMIIDPPLGSPGLLLPVLGSS